MQKTPERPLSSSVATFSMHLNRNATMPEFSYRPDIGASTLQKQTDLFASYLLKLLIPKQAGENTNFLPNYQKTDDHRIGDKSQDRATRPFFMIDAQQFETCFRLHQTQNLSALLFLNSLMSGKINPHALGVVYSRQSRKPFFTLQFSRFWSEFNFNSFPGSKPTADELTETHDLSPMSINQHLQASILSSHSEYKPWWQKTNIDLSNDVLFEELLELFLRVSLTPMYLIELLIDNIIGNYRHKEQFKQYVVNKFLNLKHNFSNLCNTHQLQLWDTMLQTRGRDYYETYVEDLTKFQLFGGARLLAMQQTQAIDYMTYNAICLNIPGFDTPDIQVSLQRCDITGVLQDSFFYFWLRIQNHWQALSTDSRYYVWDIFEALSQKLAGRNVSILDNFHDIEVLMMMKCIEFHKNQTAIVLIDQLIKIYESPHVFDVPLLHSAQILAEYPAMEIHTMTHFAQDKNQEIYSYLRRCGATGNLQKASKIQADSPMIPTSRLGLFSSKAPASEAQLRPPSTSMKKTKSVAADLDRATGRGPN